jgi:hypothetical protein
MADERDRLGEIRGDLASSLPPLRPIRAGREFNPDVQQFPQMPMPGGQGNILALAGLAAGLSGSQDPIKMIMDNIQQQRQQSMQLMMENVALNNQVEMERERGLVNDDLARRNIEAEQSWTQNQNVWKESLGLWREERQKAWSEEFQETGQRYRMEELAYERETDKIKAGIDERSRIRMMDAEIAIQFENDTYWNSLVPFRSQFGDQVEAGLKEAMEQKISPEAYFASHPIRVVQPKLDEFGNPVLNDAGKPDMDVIWSSTDIFAALEEFKELAGTIETSKRLEKFALRDVKSLEKLVTGYTKAMEIDMKAQDRRDNRAAASMYDTRHIDKRDLTGNQMGNAFRIPRRSRLISGRC